MWIVPVVLLVAGILAFLAFRGGEGGGIFNSEGPDNTIPAFGFASGKTTAISVVEEKAHTTDTVTSAATAVTSTLDGLYTEAFLDPANWRAGSYDEVWPLFAEDALATAQRDQATLTLGTAAGDEFDKVERPRGHLDVKVLLNRADQVATAVAVVRFSAIGERKDGKVTIIRSTGQYFLRPGDDGWLVYSFSVDRDDKVRTPKPGPTGSATPGTSS